MTPISQRSEGDSGFFFVPPRPALLQGAEEILQAQTRGEEEILPWLLNHLVPRLPSGDV